MREIYPLDPFPFPILSPPQAPLPSRLSISPSPVPFSFPPLPFPARPPSPSQFPPLRNRIPLNPARRSGGVLYVSFLSEIPEVEFGAF